MDTPASSPAIGGVSDSSDSVAVVVEKNKPSETTTKPDAVSVDVVPKEVNLRNGTAEKGAVDNNMPAPNVSDNRAGESETVAPTNDGPGNIEPNRGGDCDDTVKTVSLNNENDARVDSIGVEGQGDSASTAAAVASSSPTVSGGGGGVVSDSSNNTNNGLLPVGGDLKDLDQSTMSEGSGAAEEPMTTAVDIDSDTITSVTASTTEEVVVVSAGGPDSVVDDAIETQAKESATTDTQNNDNGVKGIALANGQEGNEGTVTPLAPTVVVDCGGQPTTKSVISAEDNDDEPSPVEETNVADVEKAAEVESPVAVDLTPTPPEVVVESVDVPPEDVPREEKKEIEEESSVQVMPEEDVPDEEESSLVISEVCTVEDSTNKPPVVSNDVELKLPIESVDTAEEEEEEDDCQEVDRDPDGQLGPLQLDDSQEEEAEEEEGVMLDDTVGDLGEEEENQIETIDIDTDDDEDDDGEDEDEEEEEEEGDESSLVGPPVDDEDDDDVEEVESLGEEYEEFEVSDEENGDAGDKDMSEQSTSGDEARFAEMRASNRGAKRKLHGPAAAASKTVQQSAAKERKVAW